MGKLYSDEQPVKMTGTPRSCTAREALVFIGRNKIGVVTENSPLGYTELRHYETYRRVELTPMLFTLAKDEYESSDPIETFKIKITFFYQVVNPDVVVRQTDGDADTMFQTYIRVNLEDMARQFQIGFEQSLKDEIIQWCAGNVFKQKLLAWGLQVDNLTVDVAESEATRQIRRRRAAEELKAQEAIDAAARTKDVDMAVLGSKQEVNAKRTEQVRFYISQQDWNGARLESMGDPELTKLIDQAEASANRERERQQQQQQELLSKILEIVKDNSIPESMKEVLIGQVTKTYGGQAERPAALTANEPVASLPSKKAAAAKMDEEVE